MQFNTKVLADWRAPTSAILAGSGVGLGLGAIFLAAGLAGPASENAHAQRMAQAATQGYAGFYLDDAGHGLRLGLERFRGGSDADLAAARFDADRGASKARRRSDLECLTQAVYFEARGESPRGQAAVAQVVMNRVKHPAYPKSVCAVVYQGAGRSGCQFSFACDGSMRKSREGLAWDRARGIAVAALSGAARGEIGSATHFHTTAVSPAWAPQMLRVASVGTHIFYKFSPYRLRPVESGKASVQHARLTADSPEHIPELRLMPAVLEKNIEASLAEPETAPAATTHAAPTAAHAPAVTPVATAPRPTESVALKAPQPVVAAAS